MLATANIRSSKANTLSLFLMFLIAAFLLNLGLLVALNFGNFFDKKLDQLSTSDIYYAIPGQQYNQDIEDYLASHSNITAMYKENSLWEPATVSYKGEDREFNFLFNNADNERTLSKWEFVGKHLLTDENSIYLPYFFHSDGTYQLNDKIIFEFKETALEFTIKGFIEDGYYSGVDMGLVGAYLPKEAYEKLNQELEDPRYEVVLVFANLKKIGTEIEEGIIQRIDTQYLSAADITGSLFVIDLPLLKFARTGMADIISMIMIIFASIIVTVCLIIVRFRIRNTIEDDIVKIGALKAIGYTGGQIISSIVMQFLIITVLANIVGIMISYPVIPTISDVFAQQSGLNWTQGFDIRASGISLISLLLALMLVIFFVTRRIRKINPIVALRGNITTHHFGKNYLPLDQTKGNLPLILGLKAMLQNMKQSMMIMVIMLSVAFAGVFAIIMFYNSTIDKTYFATVPGMEICNAGALINADSNRDQVKKDIAAMDHVRKVQYVDNIRLKVNGEMVSTEIMSNFNSRETKTVYEGRYPKHDNEVALSGLLAERLEKTVGDYVMVEAEGKERKFLITGLSQGGNMSGASILYDGLIPILPDFKQQNLHIYLDEGTDAEKIVQKLEKIHGDDLIGAYNADKLIEEGMSSYASIVSQLGIVILVFTIAIVVLVLYFVIHSTLIRKQRELGIQKAIGYTTWQLMNQFSFSLLLPIMLGIAFGSVIGMTQTNAIMSMAQRGMGIMQANYIVMPSWIVMFALATLVIAYLTSMLVTYRIRKISAYRLVSE